MVKASRVRIAQGPYDYCVSHSPKNWVLGFFKLGLDLGSNLLGPFGTGDRDLDLGLTKVLNFLNSKNLAFVSCVKDV